MVPIIKQIPTYSKYWTFTLDHLQEIVEPRDGLRKGLFLGPFLMLVAQISPHGETMRNASNEVDLPRLACLGEDFLGFVAEGPCEDLVDFYMVANLVG